ncbi:hypothetical protein A3D73_00220 [Candidatus Uhrbacteria bacterium RIFCSPHIGHO2_02_FULL_60_44]|nr:MAG: hypothetical protein A3D73_00220 [Candidatus Uhrbacteria bacterium RIFCSPHIGHO2_02_FULL_60_44]
MIIKRGRKWVVISETTGRSFGSYETKEEAKKRLRQVEFFKHLKNIPSSKIRKPAYRKRAR